MIHKVLPVIVGELNNYLRRAVADPEDRAIVSALVNQDGSMAFTGKDKIVSMLTAIEQERTNLNQSPSRSVRQNPPIQLNLQVLFAAYFPGNYLEALKFISLVLAYFQGKQVFTAQNTPELPNGVDKIVVEINNLDQHALNQLWSAIGAKMMPSVSMKIRMIVITRGQILQEVPEITGTDTTTSPQ